MSACDCDRKNANGGTCDSSCKEEESFGIVANGSSPVSFAPVVTKVAVAGEAVVSFEGHPEQA